MHPLINHLIQLQELTLVRDEQKAHKRTERIQPLDASIQNLTDQLPPEIRQVFLNLQKRNPIALVPISNGICAACGMKLPISLVQDVRTGDQMHHCPTCVRLLYYPETPVRHVGKAPRRTEPQRAGISRFSSHTLVVPRLQATDRDGTIRELAAIMQTAGFVDNAGRLVERALAREAILSTAMDHGLAFPHARGVEGGGLTLALGISNKGVKFDDSSKTLTRIVFLVAIPTAASAFYLKLVAGLAETFMDAEARKKLMAEEDAEKLWKVLVKLTRPAIP